jgi:hypothetical protein
VRKLNTQKAAAAGIAVTKAAQHGWKKLSLESRDRVLDALPNTVERTRQATKEGDGKLATVKNGLRATGQEIGKTTVEVWSIESRRRKEAIAKANDGYGEIEGESASDPRDGFQTT